MRRTPLTLAVLLVALTACSGGETAGTTATTATTTSTTLAPTPTTTTTTIITTTTTTPVEPADIVFRNGAVITMTEAGTVEAIAIRGDEIVAVGTTDEIAGFIGPNTGVVDLFERAVLPGFVDPHTHLLSDMGLPIVDAQWMALENGITTLADASVEPDLLDAYVAAADDLIVRVGLYLGRTDYCGEDLGTWYEAHPPREGLGAKLFIAGVKVFADGGACRDLAASQPFIDGVPIADPFFDPATLQELIGTADAAGYQVLVHAQGDLAIRDAQDAIAAVLGGGGNSLRHRIDHNSIVTADLLPRYGEIGIVPVVFGTFPTCADVAWTDFWIENGEDWRAFLDANPGLPIAWHGDDPSLPPISPLLDLASYVTRAGIRDDGSVCEPPEWLAATAITVEEGLRMMTAHAAYAIGLDEEVGSLQVGMRADLVLVSENPLAVDPMQLFDLTVVATFADGVGVWCRPGDEGLCG